MADETYTVTGVLSNEEKPDKGHGPMRSIRMNLEGIEQAVEWYAKAATDAPAVGAKLTGTVEPTQYGLKFKKARTGGFGGGGGGPRPEDPVRSKRILRQHSQDMAIGVLDLASRLGIQTPFEGVETVNDLVTRVLAVANKFDADVEEAATR